MAGNVFHEKKDGLQERWKNEVEFHHLAILYWIYTVEEAVSFFPFVIFES